MTPDVAYNSADEEYLLVYSYDAAGDDLHWEVWGRRVAWNGAWLGDSSSRSSVGPTAASISRASSGTACTMNISW